VAKSRATSNTGYVAELARLLISTGAFPPHSRQRCSAFAASSSSTAFGQGTGSKDVPKNRATFAELCRLDFDFDQETLEQALNARHRTYTADERAKIFNLTYAERQHLALRRTGSIDVDKEGRERARRDRYNAKRRADRAELRAWRQEQSQASVVRVASIDV